MEEEGSSNRNILECVRSTAKLLLQQAISKCEKCPGGQISKDIISERDELNIQRMKLTVDLKIREHLLSQPEEQSCMELNDDEAKQEVERLKEELLMEKLRHLQDCKMLKCLVHQELLFRQLALNEDSPDIYQQLSSNGQLKQVSNLLHAIEELEELRSHLQKVQEERVKLQEDCRVLISERESRKQSNGQCQEMDTKCVEDSEIERHKNEIILYRHIFLSLIGGSGVDWNETGELRDLVLSLGVQ